MHEEKSRHVSLWNSQGVSFNLVLHTSLSQPTRSVVLESSVMQSANGIEAEKVTKAELLAVFLQLVVTMPKTID